MVFFFSSYFVFRLLSLKGFSYKLSPFFCFYVNFNISLTLLFKMLL